MPSGREYGDGAAACSAVGANAMPFEPQPGDTLPIGGVSYRVAAHPVAPGIAYGQEGRASTVYQLLPEAADGRSQPLALKVFKPQYRVPALVGLADGLARFAELPGLEVCHRTVITPRRHET